jgi:AmmeMemoRadiSam system protein B
MFYPDDPGELRQTVEHALAAVSDVGGPGPKAIVAPHAGYIYSGPVAASAYARLAAASDTIHRVILLGPSHRVALEGLAVPTVDAMQTPLGIIPVDADARERVLELRGVMESDAAHALEHSLEVHLPFLQLVLGEFTVLPIVVGYTTPETVAAVLDEVWGGDETLIVVSTDLSHYHDHATATRLDAATAAAIEQGHLASIGDRDACGAYPLRGLLLAADRRGMRAHVVDLRNSGDTAGPHDRVVGYGAFVVN